MFCTPIVVCTTGAAAVWDERLAAVDGVGNDSKSSLPPEMVVRDGTIISSVGTTQFGGSDNETIGEGKKRGGYDVKKRGKAGVTYPCRTATATNGTNYRTGGSERTDDGRRLTTVARRRPSFIFYKNKR